MKGVQIYELYLSLKTHFNVERYNFFLYERKTSAGIDSYINRKDYIYFEAISNKYATEEILPVILSNIIIDKNVYIKYIATERRAHINYIKWVKRNSKLSTVYSADLMAIVDLAKNNNIPIKTIFFPKNTLEHSTLIKLFVQKYIQIETLVILNKSFDFVKNYDKIYHDPLWKEISFLIKKYSLFVTINDNKYNDITKKILLDK